MLGFGAKFFRLYGFFLGFNFFWGFFFSVLELFFFLILVFYFWGLRVLGLSGSGGTRL